MPLQLVAGFVALVAGAELLVRGASRLAAALGVPPLIIGLTVVAYGTSAPEFAVSIKAALAGQAGLALGNLVGSNIFNTLFILGLSALLTPLVVSARLVRLDVPLMIAVSLLVPIMGLDGRFGRADGLVLVGGLVAYTGFQVWQSRNERPAVVREYAQEFDDGVAREKRRWIVDAAFVTGGLVLLVLGSRGLVAGAVALARVLGIGELIIGLTIVAVGTSLPEVVTSIVAGVRGERDIAVGNVVGSNLFNLMGALGLASLLAPGAVEVAASVERFDLPVMAATALACLPIFIGGRISRWEGGLLAGYYVAYTVYLVMAATGHAALPAFGAAMRWFAIPLTIVTLVVVAVQRRRNGRVPAI
ncbi:MAG: calcium/sodium antiporter [Acidobacteriota bacterium]|nr:calcium/sodium antiporter [Acidobacteriota bacterium]